MADQDDDGGTSGERERERPALRIVQRDGVEAPEPDPWLAPNWLLTHDAVVKIFMARRGDQFLFFKKMGDFHWTGHVWEDDQRCTLENNLGELCCEISRAQKKPKPKTRLEDVGFLTSCAKRTRHLVAVPVDHFDKAEVFNMTTATVSMKANGAHGWTLGPQRREDFCSKMAGVTAERGACPTWLAFLDKITAGDAELIAYLQRMAGYCATPFTHEQSFFFCYGTGGNGKGTFLNTLKAVLGTYASQASLEMFAATKKPQHKEELAAMRGVRLLLTAETGEGGWNEAKIKTLTGGDPVRANFMHSNSFEYLPQFKIVVVGNNKPSLRNVDRAMRRRLHLIPFTVTISEDELDRTLADKLALERPAILGWVLDGYVAWRERGLDPPASVLGATESYFDNQDLLQQWLDQRCSLADPNAKTTSTALFNSWKLFCEAVGERSDSMKKFVDRLEAKGLARYHDNAGRGFHGIRLMDIGAMSA